MFARGRAKVPSGDLIYRGSRARAIRFKRSRLCPPVYPLSSSLFLSVSRRAVVSLSLLRRWHSPRLIPGQTITSRRSARRFTHIAHARVAHDRASSRFNLNCGTQNTIRGRPADSRHGFRKPRGHKTPDIFDRSYYRARLYVRAKTRDSSVSAAYDDIAVNFAQGSVARRNLYRSTTTAAESCLRDPFRTEYN